MITRTSARRPSIRRTKPKKTEAEEEKLVEGVSLSTLTSYRFSGYVFELQEGKGWRRRLLTFDGEVLKCLSKSALPNDVKKPKWELRLAKVNDIRIMESPKGPLMRTKQLPCFVIDTAEQRHILRLASVMEFECWMFTLGNCWSRPPTQPGSNSDYDACLDAWNRSLDETLSDSSSGVTSPPTKLRISESPPKIKASPTRRQLVPKAPANRNSLTTTSKSSDSVLSHRRNKSANPNPRIAALANEHSSRPLQRIPLATHPGLSRTARPRSLEHPIPNRLRGWPSHPTGTPLLRPKSLAHHTSHRPSPSPGLVNLNSLNK